MKKNLDWEEVCLTYCRKIGAKLLFVNNIDFGFETADGELVHMYYWELEDKLKELK